MSIVDVDVVITINGTDYTPSQYTRDVHLYEPGASWSALLTECPENAWSSTVIKENGTTVLTGYMLTRSFKRGGVMVNGSDTYVKVRDYFIDHEVITEYGQDVAYWINTIMGLVGVDYTYELTNSERLVYPTIHLGPSSAHDALKNVIKHSGFYTWVNPNGRVEFGPLSISGATVIDEYVMHEQHVHDEQTRHTIKIWGIGSAFGKAVGSTLGDPMERIAGASSLVLTSSAVAQALAEEALERYDSHDDERTMVLVDHYADLAVPDPVNDNGTIYPITTLSVTMTPEEGFLKTIILNERRPLVLGPLPTAYTWPPDDTVSGSTAYIMFRGRRRWMDAYSTYWEEDVISVLSAAGSYTNTNAPIDCNDYDYLLSVLWSALIRSLSVNPFNVLEYVVVKYFRDASHDDSVEGLYFKHAGGYTLLLDASDVYAQIGVNAIPYNATFCCMEEDRIWFTVVDGGYTYLCKTDDYGTTVGLIGTITGGTIVSRIYVSGNGVFLSVDNKLYRGTTAGLTLVRDFSPDQFKLAWVPRGVYNENASTQYGLYLDADEPSSGSFTVAAGSSTTVVKVSGSLTVNLYERHELKFTSGALANYRRTIISNDANSFTVDTVLPSVPSAGVTLTTTAAPYPNKTTNTWLTMESMFQPTTSGSPPYGRRVNKRAFNLTYGVIYGDLEDEYVCYGCTQNGSYYDRHFFYNHPTAEHYESALDGYLGSSGGVAINPFLPTGSGETGYGRVYRGNRILNTIPASYASPGEYSDDQFVNVSAWPNYTYKTGVRVDEIEPIRIYTL